MKRFPPQALGDIQMPRKKSFLLSGQIWKIGCFYTLVNEKDTTLLALLHGNREISQLIQTERPPPNCHGRAEAWRDASNCTYKEGEA